MVWAWLLRYRIQPCGFQHFRDGATGRQSAKVDFLSIRDRADDFRAAGRDSGVHFEGVLRVLFAFGGLGLDDFPAIAACVSA